MFEYSTKTYPSCLLFLLPSRRLIFPCRRLFAPSLPLPAAARNLPPLSLQKFSSKNKMVAEIGRLSDSSQMLGFILHKRKVNLVFFILRISSLTTEYQLIIQILVHTINLTPLSLNSKI